jgi:hypothetical protein
VAGYIEIACEEVLGRVGVALPTRCEGLASATAKWHVAMTVASGKQPEGAEEGDALASSFTRNYIASLNALIELARIPRATRLQ